MTRRFILTLMAANRVGILAAVTTALDELGGNVLEVSQTVLQDFFTIILAAEFPVEREANVVADHLRDVCRPYGIEVAIKDPREEILQGPPPKGTEKFILTVAGSDAPGVIRRLSTRLAQETIDIVDLYGVRNAVDGAFQMVLALAVPPGVDAIGLQEEIEAIGRSVGLSATLQHEDIFSATNDPRPVRVSALLSAT
jgi:glycine cleavage system transcriptional repressor